MDSRGWFTVLLHRHLWVGMLLMFALASAHANMLIVSRIQLDGRDVPAVHDVRFRAPDSRDAQNATLKQGQKLAPGTELTLPQRVRLDLTTSNGNLIRLYPGARFQSGAVTSRGEYHQPLGGQVDFVVRKALDFFNIQYDRITAGVKGTEYSVDIVPAKSLTLRVLSGVVEVERRARVTVAGVGEQKAVEADDVRVSEDVSEGSSRTYHLDAEEYLAQFKTYAEAEAYFRNALAQTEASGDQAKILRAVQNLMEIYRELGKTVATLELESRCMQLANAAISRQDEAACQTLAGNAYDSLGDYRKAIEYHDRSLAMKQILYAGRDHPAIAGSLNNVGLAYSIIGDDQKAIEVYERSLAMLNRVFKGEGHPFLVTVLDNAARSYQSLGSTKKAAQYRKRADAMKNRLQRK